MDDSLFLLWQPLRSFPPNGRLRPAIVHDINERAFSAPLSLAGLRLFPFSQPFPRNLATIPEHCGQQVIILSETMLKEGEYRDRHNLTLVLFSVNLGFRAYLIEHALAYGQIFRPDKLSVRKSKHRSASLGRGHNDDS